MYKFISNHFVIRNRKICENEFNIYNLNIYYICIYYVYAYIMHIINYKRF